MSQAQTVDIAEVIERQPIGWFTIRLVLVSWLVTFFDGFDMQVISFTVKDMSADFGISPSSFGPAFSAGIFGTFVGGLLFGYLGDRFGRRPAIILATGGFSLLTMAIALSQTYEQLLVLRFVSGLALGGAIPLTWTLNTEYVPKRYRVSVVTLIMLGYGFGATATGPIARLILPNFGWHGVFLFGGLASLGSAILLFLVLPESLRFLTSREARPEKIAKVLRRMAPTAAVPEGARFVLSDEKAKGRQPFSIGQLFQGDLKLITPLLWIAYIASSMSTWFLSAWGPLILEELGFSADEAAWLTAAKSLCGAVGAVAIMRFIDNRGASSLAVLPAVAIPLLLVAGLAPVDFTVFMGLLIVLAVFMGGSHYGIQGLVSIFYPSAIRANGTGWAGSMAKIGAVAAPLIGGYVLEVVAPIQRTYALLALCPAMFAASVMAIALIEKKAKRRAAREQAAAAPAAATVAPAE